MDTLLLLLLDSRAPAGGHNHSAGMEAAINSGWVRTAGDVADFCTGRLLTSGRVAAGFAAHAFTMWSAGAADAAGWAALDTEFDARTPSPALRAASRQLGNGLRRFVRTMLADFALPGTGPHAPHHPIVLGAAVAAAGGDVELAARAAALNAVTAPASAALRLLGLDPFAVQNMLAGMAPAIDELAAQLATDAVLPADCAPALDLLADYQLTTEVRLFAS